MASRCGQYTRLGVSPLSPWLYFALVLARDNDDDHVGIAIPVRALIWTDEREGVRCHKYVCDAGSSNGRSDCKTLVNV
jgi:hypothetical protein